MAEKIRVGVLFGGRSGEHEVSLRSAHSVMAAIDQEKYEVVPIGIDKAGHWMIGGDPMKTLAAQAAPELLTEGQSETAALSSIEHKGELVPRAQSLDRLDVVFPVLHGPYGEDGTVQGLLELAGLPYVGAGVTSSALAMDKILFKDVIRAHGLPVVPDLNFKRKRWEAEREAVMDFVIDWLQTISGQSEHTRE